MQELNGITSAAAANGGRSVVDDEDARAGYVDVQAEIAADDTAAAPNRLASPLVAVQEGGQPAVEAVLLPRLVSPIIDPEIPIALPEESFPSPRRRVTPTSSRRRQQSHRVTYEDLISRPRSNPRSRTPMRYESPLEHGAFSREVPQPQQDTFQPRAVSIRPGAGLAVGVVRPVPERVSFIISLSSRVFWLGSLLSLL